MGCETTFLLSSLKSLWVIQAGQQARMVGCRLLLRLSSLTSYAVLGDLDGTTDFRETVPFMTTENTFSGSGFCPICEDQTLFTSQYDWYRDHLLCSRCNSIPRERALSLLLNRCLPNWRTLAIHESSPTNRGISLKLQREANRYIPTHFWADRPLGSSVDGIRNENLEKQTFSDSSFDLVVTLDVMEHVNNPDQVFGEISRTLRAGGAYLFTTPTYKGLSISERRAQYHADGSITHLSEPEFHGNPIDAAGSLVTFHYGYDLPDIIRRASGMDVEVIRFNDYRHGIIGEFTEVYRAVKSA